MQPKVKKAAQAKTAVESRRIERAIIFWAIASSCGLVISGCFRLYLLQSVVARHVSVNTCLDLVVTGLAIGAGTKPMHDLITGLQKAKS